MDMALGIKNTSSTIGSIGIAIPRRPSTNAWPRSLLTEKIHVSHTASIHDPDIGALGWFIFFIETRPFAATGDERRAARFYSIVASN